MSELFDSNSAMYVLGYLMAEPQTLNKSQCLLTLNDFTKSLYKVVFGAIDELSQEGAIRIYPQDVDLYLGQYSNQYKIFSDQQGMTFLSTLEGMDLGHDENQFMFHYNRVKKFTVLRDLEKNHIDTSEFYDANADFLDIEKQMQKLDDTSIPQILDRIRAKIASIEKINFNKDGNYFQDASEGLDELLKRFAEEPDVGYPLDGEILNFACRGGRRGKMYLYSAGSGGGKTRFFVSQACLRAYPRIVDGKVVMPSELEKVYYIATEQEPDEIQTMILACVSGVNEAKIKYSNYTPEEGKLLQQAVEIIKACKGHFLIDRIPEPSIGKVRSTIVEKLLNDGEISMVVYDYIAIPEDDEGRAATRGLRSDQVLLQFSNTLKEIAVSYNIFMLTGTQITGGDVSKKLTRGFADIRDGKSIADKADFCMIGCFVSDEEYEKIQVYCTEMNIPRPDYVLDVYKNRSGQYNNCKIYRHFDLGTLRAKDLLFTTQGFKLINDTERFEYGSQEIVDIVDFLTRKKEESEC